MLTVESLKILFSALENLLLTLKIIPWEPILFL